MTAMVYLDHNATTRPLPEVVSAVTRALEVCWANPSSTHEPGQEARRLLAESRGDVAKLLGCQPAELVFTSGATEANHMAVTGALAKGRATGRTRLVFSAVEHAGLLAFARRLQADGTPVDLIPVTPDGELDLAAAQVLMGPDVALVSVMAANNETGVLMPVAELAAMAHAAGALMHVDVTQAVGKLPLNFADSGADLWSLSAHKLHGPKGVGALVVRKGVTLAMPQAGKQERGRRGGTENLPGIAGFAAAARDTAAKLDADLQHMQAMRDRLEAGLIATHPAITIFAPAAARLPNTTALRFGVLDAEQVLGKLERAGVVASSGAACSAGGTDPSHVLTAMGLDRVTAKAGVRLTLGRATTAEEIEHVLSAVRTEVLPLLAEQPETQRLAA